MTIVSKSSKNKPKGAEELSFTRREIIEPVTDRLSAAEK